MTFIRKRIQIRGDRGFTMVEMLIAMTMTLVVFGAALGLLEFSQRAQPALSKENAKIQGAQIATERIARELRQAYAISAASATSLTVLTYLPQGSSCSAAVTGTARKCRVVYTCTAGSCTRTVSEPSGSSSGSTVTIASGLSSSGIFAYNNVTPTLATALTVTLTVPASPGSAEDAITLTDGVTLRNLAGAVGT